MVYTFEKLCLWMYRKVKIFFVLKSLSFRNVDWQDCVNTLSLKEIYSKGIFGRTSQPAVSRNLPLFFDLKFNFIASSLLQSCVFMSVWADVS